MEPTAKPVSPGITEPGGREAAEIKQQLQRGDFSLLRQMLAGARQKCDWEDRHFMLELIAPSIPPQPIEAACAAEPNDADLALIYGVHLFDMVSKSRGIKVADQTTKEQIDQAAHYIKKAIPALRKAVELGPEDPSPNVFAMRTMIVFTELHTQLNQAYQKAIQLVPGFLPAHWAMVNSRAQKWGGSHEESLRIARAAISSVNSGSDLAACLFLAHLLAWQYIAAFEKDKKRGDAYLKDARVNRELNSEFDRWVRPPYQPRRSSMLYLQQAAAWFFKTDDRERLARVFALSDGAFYERAWMQVGKPRESYAAAQELANRKKSGFMGLFKS